MHDPVVVAPGGDQPGVVDAGVRLAGTRAGHDDPAMPIMHEPWAVGRAGESGVVPSEGSSDKREHVPWGQCDKCYDAIG